MFAAPDAMAQAMSRVSEPADGPNNSFKPTPLRGAA